MADTYVTTGYLLVKFFHILVAILALGTSAGLGIVLEFFGGHPTHGPFLLRAIGRIVALFVIPGYVLMLVTGLWMVHLVWPWETRWIRAALVLWALGAAILSLSLAVLRKELRLFQAEGVASPAYVRVSFLARGLGAGVGLILVSLLYLMVFKPGM